MANGPSREEFTAFTDRLYETTDTGFKGVHSRLDLLNGRTLKGEIERENIRTRIISLEKEVFNAPKRRESDVPPTPPPLFTKREGALVALGVAVVGALLKFMLVAGEFCVELAKVAIKGK